MPSRYQQDDAIGHRPILIFLEHKLAQVVLGLFAQFPLDAFEIAPRPDGIVPLRAA